jgi:hypothetical protein
MVLLLLRLLLRLLLLMRFRLNDVGILGSSLRLQFCRSLLQPFSVSGDAGLVIWMSYHPPQPPCSAREVPQLLGLLPCGL